AAPPHPESAGPLRLQRCSFQLAAMKAPVIVQWLEMRHAARSFGRPDNSLHRPLLCKRPYWTVSYRGDSRNALHDLSPRQSLIHRHCQHSSARLITGAASPEGATLGLRTVQSARNLLSIYLAYDTGARTVS